MKNVFVLFGLLCFSCQIMFCQDSIDWKSDIEVLRKELPTDVHLSDSFSDAQKGIDLVYEWVKQQ